MNAFMLILCSLFGVLCHQFIDFPELMQHQVIDPWDLMRFFILVGIVIHLYILFKACSYFIQNNSKNKWLRKHQKRIVALRGYIQ